LFVLLATHCGGMTGPQSGSESHFLDPCRMSRDCANGLSCLQGSCSRPCTRDGDCADLLSGATCGGAGAGDSDAAVEGQCTLSCVSADQCSRLTSSSAACLPSSCNLVGTWQNGGGFTSGGAPITRCSVGAIRFDAAGALSLLTAQGWVARGVYAVCGDRVEGPHLSEVFASNPHLRPGCGPEFDVATLAGDPLGADAAVSSCAIGATTKCPGASTYWYYPCLP
jgi:hypothetical protein